jgi:hypothetical protein
MGRIVPSFFDGFDRRIEQAIVAVKPNASALSA